MAATWKRTAVRYASRGAWRVVSGPGVEAARLDTSSLPSTWAVDPDWRRVVDGRAARLDARTTIEVRRPGSWQHVDPRQVDEAWSRPGPTLGLMIWAGAVGAAWWLGSSRARGPLRTLATQRRAW
ncbi:hypothetical protein [Egicoccus sp. AB-alg6-2]|uniref:hypothetical protein n=1 Tax=Egicoccus sp. AB-alg6-2 TaxID=3242692 RepID=UPI00359D339C